MPATPIDREVTITVQMRFWISFDISVHTQFLVGCVPHTGTGLLEVAMQLYPVSEIWPSAWNAYPNRRRGGRGGHTRMPSMVVVTVPRAFLPNVARHPIQTPA